LSQGEKASGKTSDHQLRPTKTCLQPARAWLVPKKTRGGRDKRHQRQAPITNDSSRSARRQPSNPGKPLPFLGLQGTSSHGAPRPRRPPELCCQSGAKSGQAHLHLMSLCPRRNYCPIKAWSKFGQPRPGHDRQNDILGAWRQRHKTVWGTCFKLL
jgi:hypothetical protein